MIRSVLASALGLGLLSSADATVYRCTIKKYAAMNLFAANFPIYVILFLSSTNQAKKYPAKMRKIKN